MQAHVGKFDGFPVAQYSFTPCYLHPSSTLLFSCMVKSLATRSRMISEKPGHYTVIIHAFGLK